MARGILAVGIGILGLFISIFTYDFFSTLIGNISESLTNTIAWAGYLALMVSVILVIPIFIATSAKREGEM